MNWTEIFFIIAAVILIILLFTDSPWEGIE
jgi:hypothetical protein